MKNNNTVPSEQEIKEAIKEIAHRIIKQDQDNKQVEETYPLIMGVECTKEEITAFLEDGRKVSIPTDWYPRTRQATLKQLKNFRISSDKYGIHWPEIGEHLSVRAFLKGLNKTLL